MIEGEIPTTHIIGRLVSEAVGSEQTVRKLFVSGFLPDNMRARAIPLLIRIGDPSAAPMLKWMLRRNVKYLYYIDDNFWELRGVGPLIDYYQCTEVRATLELIVRNAHLVIVNSALLGDYLRDKFSASVKVLPAPFDFSLLRDVDPPVMHEKEVRVGFAGSISREKDFEAIIPALERILATLPQVTLYFFGYCPPSLLGKDRVVFHAHVDNYENFIKLKYSTGLDIGLAPIADTESNRYKTNNKYREYGALGIAGIYTDSAPYRTSVKSGETGVLIEHTPDAWYDAIKDLVLNPALRLALGRAAYVDVRENYAQEVVARQWRDLLTDFQEVSSTPKLSTFVLAADTFRIKLEAWLARQKLRMHLRALRVRSLVVRVIRPRPTARGKCE